MMRLEGFKNGGTGGLMNDRYDFKKERDGVAYCIGKERDGTDYCIEMDAAGCIEAGVWDGGAVPAASCPGCVVCVLGAGSFVRQAVRGCR